MGLEKQVEEFLKRTGKFWKVWELQKKFNVVEKDEMRKILNGLEEKGIVYGEEDSYVYVIEDSVLKFGVLKKSNKKNYYVELKNHMKVLLDKEDVRNLGALEGDYVFVLLNSFRCTKKHYDTGIIKKVVKRRECMAKYIIKTWIEKDSSNQQYYFYYHGKKFFLREHELNGAFAGDCIGVEICEESGKMIAKVVEVLERKKPCKEFIKKNGEWRSIENPNYVGVLDKDSYKEDTRILANYSYVNGVFQLEFVKEISNKLWDVVLDMAQFYDFSLPDNTKNFVALDSHERRDLRDLKTFTIDPVQAKDLDDAVSIERHSDGYRLYVHIADVDAYVPFKSEVFVEAMKRGTSCYPSHFVWPMLPNRLSNELCSLNEHESKLAKTIMLDVSYSGEVLDMQVFPSLIRSDKKMSYDQVNLFLERNVMREDYLPFQQDLLAMNELSQILQSRKFKRGYLAFETSELDVILNSAEVPVEIKEEVMGPANRMIENFMLLANEVVTDYCYFLGLPFVYRNHEAPSLSKLYSLLDSMKKARFRLRKLEELRNQKGYQRYLHSVFQNCSMEERKYISGLFLRSMERACYGDSCIGHFGLALERYATVTSPIRRGSDLLNHAVLSEFFAHGVDSLKMDELREYASLVAPHLTEREMAAECFEKDVQNYLLQKYVNQYLDCTFMATVEFVAKESLYIRTDNNIWGILPLASPFQSKYSVHDQIYVRLVSTKVLDKNFSCSFERVSDLKLNRKPETK